MGDNLSLFDSVLFKITSDLLQESISLVASMKELQGEWGTLSGVLILVATVAQILKWIEKSNGQLNGESLYDFFKTCICIIVVLTAYGRINPRSFVTLPGVGKTVTYNGFKRSYSYNSQPTLLLDSFFSLKYVFDSLSNSIFDPSYFSKKIKDMRYRKKIMLEKDKICHISDPENTNIPTLSYATCMSEGPYKTKVKTKNWKDKLLKLPGAGVAIYRIDSTGDRKPWSEILGSSSNKSKSVKIENYRTELQKKMGLHGGELSQLANFFKKLAEMASIKGLLVILDAVCYSLLFICTTLVYTVQMIFMAFSFLALLIHMPAYIYEDKRNNVKETFKNFLVFSLLSFVSTMGLYLSEMLGFISDKYLVESLETFSYGGNNGAELGLFVILNIGMSIVSYLVAAAFLTRLNTFARMLLEGSVQMVSDSSGLVLGAIGTVTSILAGTSVLASQMATKNTREEKEEAGNQGRSGESSSQNSNFSEQGGDSGDGGGSGPGGGGYYNNQGQSRGDKIQKVQDVGQLKSVLPNFESGQNQEGYNSQTDNTGNALFNEKEEGDEPNGNVLEKKVSTTDLASPIVSGDGTGTAGALTSLLPEAAKKKEPRKTNNKKEDPRFNKKIDNLLKNKKGNKKSNLGKLIDGGVGVAATTGRVARFAGVTALKTAALAGQVASGNMSGASSTAKSIFKDQVSGAKILKSKAEGSYRSFNKGASSSAVNSIVKEKLNKDKTDFTMTENEYETAVENNKESLINLRERLQEREDGNYNGASNAEDIAKLKDQLAKELKRKSDLKNMEKNGLVGSNFDEGSSAREYAAKVLASGHDNYNKRRAYLNEISKDNQELAKALKNIDKNTEKVVKQIIKETKNGRLKDRTAKKIAKMKENGAIDMQAIREALKKGGK